MRYFKQNDANGYLLVAFSTNDERDVKDLIEISEEGFASLPQILQWADGTPRWKWNGIGYDEVPEPPAAATIRTEQDKLDRITMRFFKGLRDLLESTSTAQEFYAALYTKLKAALLG